MRLSAMKFRFAPRVELLESRLQPGSILLSGAAGDVSANLNAPETQSSGSDTLLTDLSLVRHRNLDLTAASVPESAGRIDHSNSSAWGGNATVAVRPSTDALAPIPVGGNVGSQSTTQAIQTATAISAAAQQAPAQSGHHPAVAHTLPATFASVPNLASFTHHGNVQVATTHRSGATPPTITFSTLNGSAGEASLNGVTRDAAGNTYAAGTADVDGSGKTVGIVNAYDASNAPLWTATVSLGGSGPEAAYGVALNTAGDTLYVAATLDDGSGDTSGAIVSLNTSDGSATGNMLVQPNAGYTGVTLDTAGNVYAGGYETATGVVPGALIAVKTDPALGAPIYVNGAVISGSLLVTTGSQAIAVDPSFNVYLAAQLQQPSGENNPTIVGLGADGASLLWGFTYLNQDAGPGGAMNAVVYRNNFVYATGTVNSIEGGTQLSQDLFLYKAPAATGDATQTGGYAFRWYVDGRTPANARVGDWGGYGLALGGLAGDQAIVSGWAVDPIQYPPNDPPTQGVDVSVTHFGSNGDTTLLHADGDPENCYGGSGDDYGHGLLLNGTDASVVGKTSSADYPTTDGSMHGGGTNDAFFTRLTVT